MQIGGSASIPIPETPVSAIIDGEVNLLGDINQRTPDAVGLTTESDDGIIIPAVEAACRNMVK